MATVKQKAHLTRLCFHESKSIVTVQRSYWLEYRSWRSPTNLSTKNIINDIWGTEPFLVVQFEPQAQSISLRRFETLPAELHKAYPTPMVHGSQVEKGARQGGKYPGICVHKASGLRIHIFAIK
ncbi:hypothetical protein AVEN_101736-1 [Araneus ventricosus]|uniref:DUF4817 domain-containing protein n=1 Tax=Araneus ventricosus TaxID=182803 RepID=A0A4Y2R2H6_ARAVE|nr:hypothetical protein AVEN_3962-1 [Araneus ventricosus]GBN69804.1 hypothetical protein AVEN_101736-1 [Araneus ventricosus]